MLKLPQKIPVTSHPRWNQCAQTNLSRVGKRSKWTQETEKRKTDGWPMPERSGRAQTCYYMWILHNHTTRCTLCTCKMAQDFEDSMTYRSSSRKLFQTRDSSPSKQKRLALCGLNALTLGKRIRCWLPNEGGQAPAHSRKKTKTDLATFFLLYVAWYKFSVIQDATICYHCCCACSVVVRKI